MTFDRYRISYSKIVVIISSLLLSINFSFAKGGAADSDAVKAAVVKIIVVSQVIDKTEPWNSTINRGSGSGFIIKGDRILTNAHVISNATFIEVHKNAETERYQAEVEAVSHDADLAVLKLKAVNPEFFKTKPLAIGQLPAIQEEVSVHGYPKGGSGLSITQGVVSRIERRSYVHKDKKLLSIQIDAAINPGNSGGPVVSNGKVIGVVMQSQSRSQSIGYMISVPVIKHFLADIKDGQYDGFPSLGVDIESIESPVLRRLYGLKDKQSGVLVTLVYPNSPSLDVLQKNDIITEVDGHKVSSNGMTELRKGELVHFKHYVDMHQLGSEVTLKIIRDQKPQKVVIKLNTVDDAFSLVAKKQFDKQPSYFVYGGFVFMPLTSDYIDAYKRLNDSITVLTQFWPTEERKEAVVLTHVLPADSNKGFHNIRNMLIKTLDGKTFKDFKSFHHLMQTGENEFVILEDQFGYQVVIDRKLALESQAAILRQYRILSGSSDDLKTTMAELKIRKMSSVVQ